MKRGFIALLMLIVLSVAIGCSGGSNSPVSPDMSAPGTPGLTGHQAAINNNGTKAIWGLWEISIDTRTWEAEITPLRGAEYTVDVVQFLQPPAGNPANLTLTVTDITNWFDQGLINVDVGLKHPFPGLDEYTGFDVLGVFATPGAKTGYYDTDVAYTDGGDDPILLNADGYTRWMNPIEFTPDGTILSFVPGKLSGSPLELFTATINGYKYFADGLALDEALNGFFGIVDNVDDRGTFKPGSFNEREYQLKFPIVDDMPALIFQYAVVASWVDPDLTLSGEPDVLDVPGDFPVSANADEAFFVNVVDNSSLYYVDGEGGGNISFALEVYDWGAYSTSSTVADEVFKIVVEAPGVIPGDFVEFDQTALAGLTSPGSSDISTIFQIDISGLNIISGDDVPVLITIENVSPDFYDPGYGFPVMENHLAGYYLYHAPVGTDIPSLIVVTLPNGGETAWQAMTYEITWETGPPSITDVMLEWSTDDFANVLTIVDSTENDGSYTWAPVPVVDTTTAKIRISDNDGSDSDTSDSDFTIASPVWLTFEDMWLADSDTVTWGNWGSYTNLPDEISPAISQATTGRVHVGFYGVNYATSSYDMMVRSEDGDWWFGSPSFWTTGGINYGRHDYNKVAPSHTGHAWMITSLWFNSPSLAYGWYSDIDRMNGGPGYYCFDGPRYDHYNDKVGEIISDTAGYLYLFGDNGTPGIQYKKTTNPGFTGGGGPGQVGPAITLTTNGIVSKSRSWARQGQGVAMVYYQTTGNIMLAETTDAPANNTWDATETIWSIGTDYTSCTNPCLAADSTDRLFAAWAAQETGGDWVILASMRTASGDSWTEAVEVYRSANALTELHISSEEVLLPTDTTEDVALVSWEENDTVYSAISPLDLMAFLVDQEVSDSAGTANSPDSMCIDKTLSGYAHDVLFAYSWDDGNWDIAIHNANFETP